MIEQNIILNMLAQISRNLDEDLYPQSYEVLCECADLELREVYYEPMSIADMFFESDKTEPMPDCIVALVRTVYNYELQEGNADAACNLGALYYTGRIGEQNYKKAIQLYTRSAEMGNMQAAENLGYCYYYGRDTEKDYKKAFHYFALGAFSGRLTSLYKIGDMYKNGYYVEKNEKEAFEIYQKCLEDLTENDLYICGADIYMRNADCFACGIGCEKNAETALAMYQRAEQLFYSRLQSGDFMIKGCYEKCISCQAKLRSELAAALPGFGWTKGEN